MSPRAISNFCAIPTALFLLFIGILHDIVGLSGLRRAIERGEIAARFGESHLVNWVFSGAAMSMLGVIVLLVQPGLRAGSRQAASVAAAIGVFVGAFAWEHEMSAAAGQSAAADGAGASAGRRSSPAPSMHAGHRTGNRAALSISMTSRSSVCTTVTTRSAPNAMSRVPAAGRRHRSGAPSLVNRT